MVAMVINVGIIKYRPLANCVRERMVMTDDQTASCDCQVPSLQEFRVACHTRSLKLSSPGICLLRVVPREDRMVSCTVMARYPHLLLRDFAER